jgi:hypothetical protein
VTPSIRVHAQASAAREGHLRKWSAEREIDLIVESDRSVLSIEVKLGRTPDDRDVRHLLWLRHQLGEELLDSLIVTSGRTAYRRPDGVAVVPAALIGP